MTLPVHVLNPSRCAVPTLCAVVLRQSSLKNVVSFLPVSNLLDGSDLPVLARRDGYQAL